MIIKRITTMLLAVLLVFNGAAVFAEDTAEAEAKPSVYQEAIDRLSALGFVELEEGEDFYPENNMTRAEFLVLAMGIIGNKEAAAAMPPENLFADVREDIWYAPYIAYAAELGVLSKVPGGYFRPDAEITANEALKILVAAMGYDMMAQSRGGYPEGYVSAAYELKLTQGLKLSANAALTRGEAAKLLDNCLERDVMVVTNGSGQNSVYEEENLLKRHNMYYGKGIITANSTTALDHPSNLGENQIQLDSGVICDTGSTDAQAYLGFQVEYVYREEADGGLTMLYVKSGKDNRVVDLAAQDIMEAGGGFIRAQEEGKNAKTYTLSKNACILYNGAYIDSFSQQMLMPKQGSVRLLSNSAGSYNIVFVEEYTNIYVGGKWEAEGILYDKYNRENQVRFSEEDVTVTFEITATDGTPVAPADIAVGDVVSVYKSQGGQNIRAVVSREIIQGKASGVNQDKEILMDGQKYKLTQQLYEYMQDETNDTVQMIRAGMNVKLYLDGAGFVAACEVLANNQRTLAYMKGAAIVESDGEPAVLIKLFTAKGDHEKYMCADRVKIDGISYKGENDIYKALCGNRDYAIGRLVTFTLDDANEINYIDTSFQGKGEEEGTLFETYSSYEYNEDTKTHVAKDRMFLTYKNKMMSLGMQLLIRETTPIFMIPNNDAWNAEENYFSMKDINELQNDQQINCESFQFDRNSYYTDALVIYTNDTAGTVSIDNNSNAAVVKEVSVGEYNGEICVQITAVTDGKEVILYPRDEETFHNIKPKSNIYPDKDSDGNPIDITYANFREGDVFRYKKLADGTVGAVEMLIGTEGERLGNGSEAKEIAYAEESNKFAQMRFALRNVYGKKDGILRLTPGDPGEVTGLAAYSLEVQKASSFQITVVDTSGRSIEVRKGTVNDIRDYQSSGGSHSTVLVQTRYGDARSIIVFDQTVNHP